MSRGFRATWNITGHVKDDTLIVEHFYVPALSSENMQVNLDNLIDNDLISKYLINKIISLFYYFFKKLNFIMFYYCGIAYCVINRNWLIQLQKSVIY